jgi:hypothetical protein
MEKEHLMEDLNILIIVASLIIAAVCCVRDWIKK